MINEFGSRIYIFKEFYNEEVYSNRTRFSYVFDFIMPEV